MGKFHVLPALAKPRVPKGHLKDKLDRIHRAPKHHQKQTIRPAPYYFSEEDGGYSLHPPPHPSLPWLRLYILHPRYTPLQPRCTPWTTTRPNSWPSWWYEPSKPTPETLNPKPQPPQTPVAALREGGQPKPYGVFLAQLLGVQRESVVGSSVKDVGFRRFRRFRSIEAFGI